MAELDRKKLVNAGNLQDVAHGIYRKSTEQIEGHKNAKTSHEATQVNFKAKGETVVPLGGIPAGTSLDNMSVQDLLTKLLFPHSDHEITNVESTPNGGVYEKGTTQTLTQVKGLVTRRSNPITKIEVLDGDRVLASKEEDIEVDVYTTFDLSEPVTSDKNFQFAAYANDEEGEPLKKFVNTEDFVFIYPYYYGVLDEEEVITDDVISNLTKVIEVKSDKTLSFTTKKQHMVFAYPKEYGELFSIRDNNSFENINSFTLQTFSVKCLDGTSQEYYVYISGASTITDFIFNFSY